jgi:branched-chain amino acid transport system permease protein
MKRAFYPLLAVALVVFPYVFHLPPFYGYGGLATQILILGIAAIGFNLLLGYAGLLSYGHAAFYGLGSYAAALSVLKFFPSTHSFGLALLVGVIIGGLAAALVGAFVVRLYGIYFALLTVAFAQMAYFIVFQWRSLTNGDDGLQGITTPHLNLGVAQIDLNSALPALPLGPFGDLSDVKCWYVYVALVTFLVVAFVRTVVNSQFGEALSAIRQNEERSTFVGYDPQRYKFAVFVISGILCGLAGALRGLYEGSTALDSLTIEQSGSFAIYTIVGGTGTLLGPLIGTALVMWLQNVVSAVTPAWRLIEGLLFVAVIVFLPHGIFGTFVKARAKDGFSWRRVLEIK